MIYSNKYKNKTTFEKQWVNIYLIPEYKIAEGSTNRSSKKEYSNGYVENQLFN